MKKNIKTYVDIEEVKYSFYAYYKVSFITSYDITFLGKYIKTKTETYEVPFWFQSLDVAKDFCEINPEKIKHTYIVNSNYSDRKVYYETYVLEVNEQEFYVKWTDWSIKIDDSYDYSFDLHPHRVVDAFVSGIHLTDWMHTHGLKNVSFDKEYSKLSDLVSIKSNKKNSDNKHWRFELVKNENE